MGALLSSRYSNSKQNFFNNPKKHIDIGSRIDGFVAHVASFREIEVYDIRPLPEQILNVKFVQADIMLHHDSLNGCTDSISCLHAIEHFGLGRYGDSLDPNGHLKGLNAIYRMLKPNGKFYFSTPIGPQRIEFNAHRIFSIRYLLDLFSPYYTIDDFSFVDDSGILHKHISLDSTQVQENFGCNYGCGIFEMTKR